MLFECQTAEAVPWEHRIGSKLVYTQTRKVRLGLVSQQGGQPQVPQKKEESSSSWQRFIHGSAITTGYLYVVCVGPNLVD